MSYLIAQKIAWVLGKVLLPIFFRVRAEGREHLVDLKPPCIAASNHRTYLDHFFILSALPWASPLIPIRAMAHDALYRHTVIRWGLTVLGAFPMRKGEGGIDASLEIPLRILQEKGTIGIYPEGHRAHDKLFGEPRRGAALLALRTGAPVLPIALMGFEGGMKLRDWITRASVTIRFGKPFLLTEKMGVSANPDLFHDDPIVWEGAEMIMERIKALYQKKATPFN